MRRLIKLRMITDSVAPASVRLFLTIRDNLARGGTVSQRKGSTLSRGKRFRSSAIILQLRMFLPRHDVYETRKFAIFENRPLERIIYLTSSKNDY